MGERIAAYRVMGPLGRGGYGEVVEAVHEVLGRSVAIKVLHAKWSEDAEAVRRFVAEARAVNAARHPNIVDIVDFGTLADGRHYHVMERLVGETLRARLDARGTLPLAEAVEILGPIASALDAAHAAGVVHRDVKPENVFLHHDGERETVKLIDFGLAKLAMLDAAPTQSGVIMGTPAYMAPEQCRGEPVSGRTDAYALGVIAYEMLTGEVPLRGADPVATLLAHVHETPEPPSARAPLSRAVDRTVLALLAKRSDERPDPLVTAVAELAAAIGAPARRPRRGLWLAAAVVAVGGGVAAFALATRSSSDSPRTHIAPPGVAQPVAPSESAGAKPTVTGPAPATAAPPGGGSLAPKVRAAPSTPPGAKPHAGPNPEDVEPYGTPRATK